MSEKTRRHFDAEEKVKKNNIFLHKRDFVF